MKYGFKKGKNNRLFQSIFTHLGRFIQNEYKTKENIMKSQKAVMSQTTSYYFFHTFLYWIKFCVGFGVSYKCYMMHKPYLKL